MADLRVEIIEREFLLVGESITANFPESFPEAAIKVQQGFERKMDSIPNAVDRKVLISPYMRNELMVTYFACLEVIDLTQIPDGMSGFRIPLTKYAKITCTNRNIDKGYSQLYDWIKENSLELNRCESSSPIEIFHLEAIALEERVEIFMPIKSIEQ
ncbi:GyrI-like domain-containing protein [Rossellomorea vietnamensis]|uniref:GyrI-like domain-containing protein n=1 Tax=Rossellomorea vietnamensis TaxID=218284 RepID=A0A5D4KA43_9BACI|nr:GyrI-like domain-containing protein [Rossellomorea vietnamensis]TYR74251.1 GyrI-like domain-containing protein [Rossellomorea vietnamensis]